MALSVKALTGMPIHRFTGKTERLWVPGDPGVTFTRGNVYVMSGGVLVAASDSSAGPYFRAERTVTCPAATTNFPRLIDFKPHEPDDSLMQTLIPVVPMIPAGTPVLKAKIANQADDTVASVAAGTRSIGLTTGAGADDRPNGGLIYLQTGTGAGELNVIEDYDHAGGNVELEAITHRTSRAAAADTGFFLSSITAANAVGPFGRMDLDGTDTVDMSDGADDGNFVLYGSWEELLTLIPDGHLPIIEFNRLSA